MQKKYRNAMKDLKYTQIERIATSTRKGQNILHIKTQPLKIVSSKRLALVILILHDLENSVYNKSTRPDKLSQKHPKRETT